MTFRQPNFVQYSTIDQQFSCLEFVILILILSRVASDFKSEVQSVAKFEEFPVHYSVNGCSVGAINGVTGRVRFLGDSGGGGRDIIRFTILFYQIYQ